MTDPNPKRLICAYDKPGNISQLVDYYLAFLTGMREDQLFDPIAILLEEAETQVKKLQLAEQAALTKVPGKVTVRNTELQTTEIKMDKVLAKVQEAGDDDMPHAATIFSSHQLKILEYGPRERDTFEVRHGKTTKTFEVINKPVAKRAGYVWMISMDKVNWFLGDFGPNADGLIDSCDDDELILGKLYYVKTRSSVKGVKSDWSQIIEIYCI